MPTLLICGDPHGQFQHIIEATQSSPVDAVILLGDMDLSRPLDVELAPIIDQTQVWWIPGNHDTDNESKYDNLFHSSLADRNLHGRIVDIAGVRVAGLGGVFRGRVWDGEKITYQSQQAYFEVFGKGNRWRGGLPLKHRSTIFPQEVEDLSKGRAEILVTHEAPGEHKLGYPTLTNLAKELQVKYAFHGHHHEQIAYPDGVWHGVAICGIHKVKI